MTPPEQARVMMWCGGMSIPRASTTGPRARTAVERRRQYARWRQRVFQLHTQYPDGCGDLKFCVRHARDGARIMSKEMINFIGKQWTRRSQHDNAEAVVAFVKGSGMLVVQRPLAQHNNIRQRQLSVSDSAVSLTPPVPTTSTRHHIASLDRSLSDSDDDPASIS